MGFKCFGALVLCLRHADDVHETLLLCRNRDAVADCHRRTYQFDCLHHFLNVRVINFFLQPLKKGNVKKPIIHLLPLYKTCLSILIKCRTVSQDCPCPHRQLGVLRSHSVLPHWEGAVILGKANKTLFKSDWDISQLIGCKILFFSHLTDSKKTLLWAGSRGGSIPPSVPLNTWSCYNWLMACSTWGHRLSTPLLVL